MKIVGIENSMSLEELESDINERNFYKYNSKCTAIHSYGSGKQRNLQSVIIEVTSELYTGVKRNGNRIYIGHQSCRVFDDLNLVPCYNCGRFGHNRKKCMNAPLCLICAGQHTTEDCDNNQLNA